VFEQSILLNHNAARQWNFVASLGAELLVVSLAFLIPLAYNDHLPGFHWKSITMRPAPAPLPVEPAPTRNPAATGTLSVAPAPRPIFHFDPRTSSHPAQAVSIVIPGDAPPSIGGNSVGESANQMGKFLANMPAPLTSKPPAAHPNTPSAPVSSVPIKVGGSVQMAKLIRKVIPEYPVLAKGARISGVVHLIGIIAKDGTIRDLRLVGGHPLLAHAAMQAVEQWVYEPTLLNGEPVEVIAPIEVSFTLGP
jgi:protein TonB